MVFPKFPPTATPNPWHVKKKTLEEQVKELNYEEEQYEQESAMAVMVGAKIHVMGIAHTLSPSDMEADPVPKPRSPDGWHGNAADRMEPVDHSTPIQYDHVDVSWSTWRDIILLKHPELV